MSNAIPENSRQFPREEKIVKNKNFVDKIYGYLQSISYRDEETDARRYLEPSQLNYSAIGRAVGISRQTVKSKIAFMMPVSEDNKNGLGILTYDGGKDRYYLELFPATEAILIERDLLHYMSITFSKYVITIYSYLFLRWYAVTTNGGSQFEFMIDKIKDVIGFSHNSNSNDDDIKDMLSTMREVGLIDYNVRVEYQGTKQKNHYTITNVVNKKEEVKALK